MTPTIIIICIVALFFAARFKSTISNILDIVDDGLAVGKVHVEAMREDAHLSAQLNSIEKKAELSKRLKKFDMKDDSGQAITLDSLKSK